MLNDTPKTRRMGRVSNEEAKQHEKCILAQSQVCSLKPEWSELIEKRNSRGTSLKFRNYSISDIEVPASGVVKANGENNLFHFSTVLMSLNHKAFYVSGEFRLSCRIAQHQSRKKPFHDFPFSCRAYSANWNFKFPHGEDGGRLLGNDKKVEAKIIKKI